MNSVLKCLDVDYGEKITFEESKELVLDEIYSDVTRYAGFHTGNNREVIKQSELYFEKGIEMYNKDITDVIVCTAANALQTNFAVFQNIGENAVIIYTNCNKVITPKTVFLKLDYYPGDSSKNHYSAIVIDDKAVKKSQEGTCTESPVEQMCSNTNNEVSQQPSEASDCGDESDNSGHGSFQFPVQDPPTPKKRGKTRKTRGRNHLDMTCFQTVPVEVMDEMPWDIDGNRIITVSCNADFWIDCTKDGRWWRTVQSSHKDLKGECKFLTCTGSFVCNNPTCSKLTSEGVKNCIDFKKERHSGYTCKCCGYYVKKKYCGAMKAMEYDEISNCVTVYHQGNHNCTLKPDKRKKFEFAQVETLNSDLRKTPKELKIDLIGYQLAQGEVEKAWEIAEKMDDNSIIEKLHYMRKSGSVSNV